MDLKDLKIGECVVSKTLEEPHKNDTLIKKGFKRSDELFNKMQKEHPDSEEYLKLEKEYREEMKKLGALQRERLRDSFHEPHTNYKTRR